MSLYQIIVMISSTFAIYQAQEHVWKEQHRGDWQEARVKKVVDHYWNRRVMEVILIQDQKQSFNLDCGLELNPAWIPYSTIELN